VQCLEAAPGSIALLWTFFFFFFFKKKKKIAHISSTAEKKKKKEKEHRTSNQGGWLSHPMVKGCGSTIPNGFFVCLFV